MNDAGPEPIRRGREALARSVADFATPAEAWELVVQCAGTCFLQQRPVAALAAHLPPGCTWGEAIRKLRCSHCGEPASLVGLRGPPIASEGSRRAWAMLLHSPGPWRP
jgi:hypothetical protein